MRHVFSVMVVCSLVLGLLGCRSPAKRSETKRAPVAPTLTSRIVEAGCASCIFNIKGVKGCKLAVKIGAKPYLVTGSDMDDHGDAHGPSGLCVTARKALVTGQIEGDKFAAKSFELQP